MGRRGPPKQPTALKIARGNPGKRPLNDREPKPPSGIPDTPDGLTELAKAHWDRVVPALDQMGVLTRTDGIALETYCREWARWRSAHEKTEKMPMVPLKDKSGEVIGFVESPYSKLATKLAPILQKYEREFGLTPSSRADIKLPDGKGDDLERFLASTQFVG